MAQYNTEGIVIGGNKFGEADRILRILTKERGKISAIAKGVRRGTSKFSGCLEPMMVNDFLLAEGRNMEIVCQAENIRNYSRIHSDYALINCAGRLLEAAAKLTEEGLPDPMTYGLLVGALDALESGAQAELTELIFKCCLLQGHGIFPDLTGCNDCGKKRTKAIHFDGKQMAFLCSDCAGSKGIHHPISKDALNGLYSASKADPAMSLPYLQDIKVEGDIEDALRLADEILSAFLQAGLGRARDERRR
jgi:DNA repair protein RecO (recombination protein O)